MARPIPTDIPDDDKARFWSKVDVRGPDECWPWTGRSTRAGYGRVRIYRSIFLASRLSLQMHIGRALLPNELACHTCDNPPCVNPAHLFVGSNRDNMLDAVAKGRLHKWNGTRVGQANPNSKLTVEQVLEIRALAATDLRQNKMSLRFGVSEGTISNVIRRRTFANVK